MYTCVNGRISQEGSAGVNEVSARSSQDRVSLDSAGGGVVRSNGESVRSSPAVTPKSLSAGDLETDLDLGSVVELDLDGSVHYGVLRWIGYVQDRSQPIAGVELVS